MQPSEEIIFEKRDLEIFKIPDVKTKLDTLQNYFFPRLKRLIDKSLEIVTEVYAINPHDKFTFNYTPSHRKNAKNNSYFGVVKIGIGGKRAASKTLKVLNSQGKPYVFHPSELSFEVLPNGKIFVRLLPFKYAVEKNYVLKIKRALEENSDTIQTLFSLFHIAHNTFSDNLVTFNKLMNNLDEFDLKSSHYYFPVDITSGLEELVVSFLVLYPILELCFDIAEGNDTFLETRLKVFMDWLNKEQTEEAIESDEADVAKITIPVLDNYRFVRPGLWWQVLARDHWTCCSCGRKAKDGVTLEVDHILPRSKGGKDEIKNLQTLCKKCNIGKSNKDDTDLRSL